MVFVKRSPVSIICCVSVGDAACARGRIVLNMHLMLA